MTGTDSLINQIIEVAKSRGMKQKDLAVSARISEETLSRAKKRGSTRLDLVQALAKAAGVQIGIVTPASVKAVRPLARTFQRKASPESFRNRYRQFAWANPNASVEVVLRRALLRAEFQPLLDASLELGFNKVMQEWNALKAEGGPETLRAASITERILRNIRNGQQQATA